MRRIIILLSLMAVMVAIFAAAAFAVTKTGTQNDDLLIGTDNSDNLYGLNGADILRGHGGNDYLEAGRGDDAVYGGDGNDHIYLGGGNDQAYGGPGDDTINAVDGVVSNDFVSGGAGTNDRCFVDSFDEADSSCEHIIVSN
jgi:Ca2+-binding RTX toxin-like protein